MQPYVIFGLVALLAMASVCLSAGYERLLELKKEKRILTDERDELSFERDIARAARDRAEACTAAERNYVATLQTALTEVNTELRTEQNWASQLASRLCQLGGELESERLSRKAEVDRLKSHNIDLLDALQERLDAEVTPAEPDAPLKAGDRVRVIMPKWQGHEATILAIDMLTGWHVLSDGNVFQADALEPAWSPEPPEPKSDLREGDRVMILVGANTGTEVEIKRIPGAGGHEPVYVANIDGIEVGYFGAELAFVSRPAEPNEIRPKPAVPFKVNVVGMNDVGAEHPTRAMERAIAEEFAQQDREDDVTEAYDTLEPFREMVRTYHDQRDPLTNFQAAVAWEAGQLFEKIEAELKAREIPQEFVDHEGLGQYVIKTCRHCGLALGEGCPVMFCLRA